MYLPNRRYINLINDLDNKPGKNYKIICNKTNKELVLNIKTNDVYFGKTNDDKECNIWSKIDSCNNDGVFCLIADYRDGHGCSHNLDHGEKRNYLYASQNINWFKLNENCQLCLLDNRLIICDTHDNNNRIQLNRIKAMTHKEQIYGQKGIRLERTQEQYYIRNKAKMKF